MLVAVDLASLAGVKLTMLVTVDQALLGAGDLDSWKAYW
jgi:hypothetical protein